jgi:thiol-disulfide isomerase/thioredoxin
MKLIFSLIAFFFFKISNASSISNLVENDSVYLINNTNMRVGFTFHDKFNEIHQVRVLPKQKLAIQNIDKLLITQTNEYQNFFLVYHGEVLTIEEVGDGNITLVNNKNAIRTNDLKLGVIINTEAKDHFWTINKKMGIFFDSDIKKMDSIYKENFFERLNIIDNFCKVNTVSDVYKKFILHFVEANYLGSQYWLAINSKANISEEYIKYLKLCTDKVYRISSDTLFSQYTSLGLSYLKFKNRNVQKSKYYIDTLYTSIKEAKSFLGKEKYLYRILKNYIDSSKNHTAWFIEDFLKNCNDIDYINDIQARVNNKKILSSISFKDPIASVNAKIYSFDVLLKKQLGKLVYIDFWASWCAPCREEMKHSRSLQSKLVNKNISFLYISIDENTESWKRALTEEQHQIENTFLLLDFQKSAVKKEFKIGAIPRYILFDKNGKMILEKAPRPSDPKLISQLEKYLY